MLIYLLLFLTITTCAGDGDCSLPTLGYKIAVGTCAGSTLAAGATCTVAAENGYTTSGSGDITCNENSTLTTNDLAVTGCAANFYQQYGGMRVCTACSSTDTLAAATFGDSNTVCVAVCKLPALGYKIAVGTCGIAGSTADAGSTCTVAAETGYTFTGSADNVCATDSVSFTANDLAVTGCAANFYQSNGTTATDGVCTACGHGATLTASTFGSISVCSCASGAFLNSSNMCENCPIGTFLNSSTTCEQCAVGKYQDNIAQSVCKFCPKGYWMSQPGLHLCLECFVLYYGNEVGLTWWNCSGLCADGYEGSSVGQTAQTCNNPCPKGKYGIDGSCISCPLSTYGNEVGLTNSNCSGLCAAGYYYTPDSGITVVAPTNVDGSTNSTTNIAHTTINITDTHIGAEDSTCDGACPVGKYSKIGSSSCTYCTPGYYQNNDAQPSCKPTDAGYYANGTGLVVQTKCPVGFFANISYETCIRCQKGRYGDSSTTSICKTCPNGYFTNETSQTSCTMCPVGLFTSYEQTISCIGCQPGLYLDDDTCKSCPNGYFTNKVSLPNCTMCAAGTYSTSRSCSDCVGGRFGVSGMLYSSDCSGICSAGKFSTARSTNCTNCTAGMYSSEDGWSACLNCPAGRVRKEYGHNDYLECIVGTYQNLVGKLECTQCLAGKYLSYTGATTQNSCEYCTGGYYGDNAGETLATCTGQCPAGKYSTFGVCVFCAIGTYTNTPGTSECTTASAQYYVNTSGATDQIFCPDGFETTGTACTACASGHYSMNSSSTCAACGSGQYQDEVGKQTCKNCTIGRAQDHTGKGHCKLCQSGQYQDEVQKIACKNCTANKYLYNYGDSRVDDPEKHDAESDCQTCPTTTTSVAGSSFCTCTNDNGTLLNNEPHCKCDGETCLSGQYCYTHQVGHNRCDTSIGTYPVFDSGIWKYKQKCSGGNLLDICFCKDTTVGNVWNSTKCDINQYCIDDAYCNYNPGCLHSDGVTPEDVKCQCSEHETCEGLKTTCMSGGQCDNDVCKPNAPAEIGKVCRCEGLTGSLVDQQGGDCNTPTDTCRICNEQTYCFNPTNTRTDITVVAQQGCLYSPAEQCSYHFGLRPNVYSDNMCKCGATFCLSSTETGCKDNASSVT